MNYEMVAKVRDRIAEVGDEHCDMSTWTYGVYELHGSGPLGCGTTACIAGHTVAVARGSASWSAWFSEPARDYLGLHSTALFHDEMWPFRYRQILQEEGDAKAMLAILDDLLDGKVVDALDGLQEVSL